MAKAKMQRRGIYLFLFICSVSLGCAPSNGNRGGRFTFAGAARGPDFIVLAKELQPAVVNVSAALAGTVAPPSGQGSQAEPEGE